MQQANWSRAYLPNESDEVEEEEEAEEEWVLREGEEGVRDLQK